MASMECSVPPARFTSDGRPGVTVRLFEESAIENFDVYKVTVAKDIGVHMHFGISTTGDHRIPAEILRVLPDATGQTTVFSVNSSATRQMTTVFSVNSSVMKEAGVRKGDILLNRQSVRTSSIGRMEMLESQGTWTLLRDLRSILTNAFNKSSFTFFVARKTASALSKPMKSLGRQQMSKSERVSTSAATTNTSGVLASTPQNGSSLSATTVNSTVASSRSSTVVAVPSDGATVSSVGQFFKGAYVVYHVFISKRWKQPLSLGCTMSSCKAIKPDEQFIFPGCTEKVYVVSVENRQLAPEGNLYGLLPGDILLQSKCSDFDRLKMRYNQPEEFDSVWTLMSLAGFQSRIAAATNAFHFSFFVARKTSESATVSAASVGNSMALPALYNELSGVMLDGKIMKGTYDLYQVHLWKQWGHPIHPLLLGLTMTATTSIMPDEQRTFPGCNEKVYIATVENSRLLPAGYGIGVLPGDILLQQKCSDSDRFLLRYNRPDEYDSAWTLMSLADFHSRIAAATSGCCFSFYVARKTIEARMASASGVGKCIPDILSPPPEKDGPKTKATGSENHRAFKSQSAPTASISPLPPSGVGAVAMTAKATSTPMASLSHIHSARVVLIGPCFNGTYNIYRVTTMKPGGRPFTLGLTLRGTKSSKANEQGLFPSCKERAYIDSVENSLLSPKSSRLGVLPGDVLVHTKCAEGQLLRWQLYKPEMFDTAWTLMSLKDFNKRVDAATSQFSFELYVAREMPVAPGDAQPTGNANCIPGLAVPNLANPTSTAGPENHLLGKRRSDVLTNDCESERHSKLPKQPSPGLSHFSLPALRSRRSVLEDLEIDVPHARFESRRVTMTPTTTPAPEQLANAKPPASPVASQGSGDSSGTDREDGRGADSTGATSADIAYNQMLSLVLPENRSLHDECEEILRRAKRTEQCALEALNALNRYKVLPATILSQARDCSLSRLYSSRLYPILLPPTLNLADVAFWTKLGKFTDDVRTQSAELQLIKAKLQVESVRRKKQLTDLKNSLFSWLAEFKEAAKKLGQLRTDAMGAFDLLSADPY